MLGEAARRAIEAPPRFHRRGVDRRRRERVQTQHGSRDAIRRAPKVRSDSRSRFPHRGPVEVRRRSPPSSRHDCRARFPTGSNTTHPGPAVMLPRAGSSSGVPDKMRLTSWTCGVSLGSGGEADSTIWQPFRCGCNHRDRTAAARSTKRGANY